MSGRNVTVILLAVVALFLVSNSLYVIKETERAVLLQFGEVVNPNIEPGLHWKIPFVNNVRKFDGRLLTVDSQPERFFTQEQKALIVDSYAKFRIKDTAKFYTATNGEESRAMGLLSQRINNGLRNQVAVRTIQEPGVPILVGHIGPQERSRGNYMGIIERNMGGIIGHNNTAPHCHR